MVLHAHQLFAVEKERLEAQKEGDATCRATRDAALAQLRRGREEVAARLAEAQGDEERQREEEVRLQAVGASEAEFFKAELDRFKNRQLAKAQKAASDAILTLGHKPRSSDINYDISKRPITNVQSLIALITSLQFTSDAQEAAIREARRILGMEITLTDLGKANVSEILGHVARNATAYVDLRREDSDCSDALIASIIKGYFEEHVEGCGSMRGGESAQGIQANFVSVAAEGE